jgi:hypothetical protein
VRIKNSSHPKAKSPWNRNSKGFLKVMGVGGFELPGIFLKHAAIRRKVLCYAVCPSALFKTFI